MASRTPLFIGGAAVVIIVAVIVGWLALRGGDEGDEVAGDLGATEVIEEETPPSGISTTEVVPGQDFEKPDLKIPYFDFDRYYIRSDAASALSYDLKWLREHPDTPMILEGHCDVRGTYEYNLALGQKRAQAVKSWLARQTGTNPQRFDIISYGKERLVDFGTTEEAHQRNRRVEFTITKR